MKLHSAFPLIVFIVTLFIFSGCSLSTLSFSLISTESNDSDANSGIVNLSVKVSPTSENTSISWRAYKITPDNGNDYYQESYTILRSVKNPWEGFETVATRFFSQSASNGGRLSFTDTAIKYGSPAVWYRIYFSYTEKSGDSLVKTVILSESVRN